MSDLAADDLPEWARRAFADADAVAKAAPAQAVATPGGHARPALKAAGGLADYERAKLYAAKVPAAGEGQRNKMLYYLGCQLLNLFPALSEGEHKELCGLWAMLCSPPLEAREAEPTIASAWRSCHARGRVGNKATEWRARASALAGKPPVARMPGAQASGAPAPGGDEPAQGEGAIEAPEAPAAGTWLDEHLQAELHEVRQLAGLARDGAVVELFDRLSYALQGAEPVTRDRVKELVCTELDMGKRAYDQQLKVARLKQAEAEAGARDSTGLNAGGDFDWAGLAEKYLGAVRDGSWAAV